MSVFGNLFGRKAQTPEEALLNQQFDDAWGEAVRRFGIVTGLGAFNIALTHPKTGKPLSPREGLGQTFGEWKQIRSPTDRRALLFDQIARTVIQSMKRWQVANYLMANRDPAKAFVLLEEAAAPETTSAGYQAATAKALLHLGRPAEALAHAKLALEMEPDNGRLQSLHADALHLVGQCEEAHAVYTSLMKTVAPMTEETASIAPLFSSVLSQETGVAPSPVLAVDFAEHWKDPMQAEELWSLGETEFYDSPYFRMRHAYHLADSGDWKRGFVKLLALVKEMPWLKEPSLNLLILFEKMDPTGQQMMPEVQAKLRQTIQDKGWTTEGMTPMTLDING